MKNLTTYEPLEFLPGHQYTFSLTFSPAADFNTFFITFGAVSAASWQDGAGYLSKQEKDYIEIAGVKWAKTNLGAADETGYGNMYRFGRTKVWDAASSSATSIPAGSSWISNDNGPAADWDMSPTSMTNPCPAGWRVPTKDEMAATETKQDNWTPNYNGSGIAGFTFTDGTSGDVLFLPAAGYRSGSDGSLNGQGIEGRYWSATIPSSGSYYGYSLNFDSGQGAYMNYYDNRSYGYSVRCVRN